MRKDKNLHSNVKSEEKQGGEGRSKYQNTKVREKGWGEGHPGVWSNSSAAYGRDHGGVGISLQPVEYLIPEHVDIS